jgi:hypothetical protein
VQPLRAAYRALIGHLGGVDAIVLVDGGTDILMRGDENGLGTPEEDMASLGAVNGLTEVPQRLVACIGFGVDSYHGLNPPLPEGGDSWLRPPPGAALQEVLRHRHQPG